MAVENQERRLVAEIGQSIVVDCGFFIEQNVLSKRECSVVIDAISGNSTKRSRAGVRHLMSNSVVASVAADHRMLKIARERLGQNAVPFRATLFEKTGRANWLVVWHQDTALPLLNRFDSPQWGPWSTKEGTLYVHAPATALSQVFALRIHLDASTHENGPLRVIPGSHAGGVLNDHEILQAARSEPHVECTVSQGGVLAMSPLLIHSSSKVRDDRPRRVLHIEYATSLTLSPGIRLAIA